MSSISLPSQLAEERTGLDRDEASAWIRWMKSTPTPLIVDLSQEFRDCANATIPDIDFSWQELLNSGEMLMLLASLSMAVGTVLIRFVCRHEQLEVF